MGSPKADSLPRRWLSLPEALRARLRLGFTGKGHLLDVAGWCLRSGGPGLSPIAADALETAVRENPLDGAMARELLALEPARALLDPATADRLTRLAARWQPPADPDGYRRLQAARDFHGLKAFTRAAAADQPGNLFWIEQGVVAGCMDGDHDFIVEFIKGSTFDGVEDAVEQALSRVNALFEPESAPGAEALRRQAARRPWDAGLALRAFDALGGVADRRDSLPGSVAVCLYSWNKAGELAETLDSLAASGLAVDLDSNEPPDHLAIELEYLYHLLATGWSGDDPTPAAQGGEFAATVMLPWVRRFRDALAGADPHAVFLAAADLVVASLESVPRA